MEAQPIKPGKFAINYGVILGVIMIALSVIAYVTGQALAGAQWPQLTYYVLFPIIIIYAISQYKKHNANVLSLGTAIKLGVVIGVISAIVYVIYGILFNYVIDPEFMGQIMEVARDNMIEQNPEMTDEMIEQSMSIMEMMFNPFIGSAFWVAASALFGLIWSLIGGLVMRSNS
ncbi:DUF4199 domain-containing protein [Psychroserpens sp.]|uniref:DUF4199 domain-containing protein n=1 Tax=Psychroserpens sp. TaxID=2020870 RepID=UPI001B0C7E15|nr:DUF4199 domain-containing protein [Psychroserpens sp.]MBO6607050.1 DUF4199 domain-containing protein [Psychroserpens sp.]MBO6631676.1 DUF4199 domain-containing protein [Psychroserpens sp.]MBO6654196.1 DUF4199 domain-containing protein [Psychroserpens sp.]MBO6682518.1 DUF4199 domain-containing protein [Psychroserpens sp.]MBO6750822.1 DUF4199 domain-containing protein [Psychroserpens sp.]